VPVPVPVPASADGTSAVAGPQARAPDHVSPPDPGALSSQVALLALVDLEPRSRGWGWLRFVTGRLAVRGAPGLRFVKVLGSGRGGGFGTTPSATIQGLFCVFDDAASADAFVSPTGPFQAWRTRARECFTVKLRAYSVRGSWAGMRPIAALTRASIRPTRARRFWRMEPQAELELEAAHGCLLATGVGEAPYLRQATFTLWDSVASMDAYARTGAHLAAIRASAQGAFFSESMFVRFVPEGAQGSWRGRRLA
jgi:hypothetical protein